MSHHCLPLPVPRPLQRVQVVISQPKPPLSAPPAAPAPEIMPPEPIKPDMIAHIKQPLKPRPMPQPQPKPKPAPARPPAPEPIAELNPSPPPDRSDTAAAETAAPVFGLTPESIAGEVGEPGAGFAVRVGNTLMQPMEETFTPPDQVAPYQLVPTYQLTRLPSYQTRITPEYPKALIADELEGEVVLIVTIDAEGKVVQVEVKASDHPLFAEAAIRAMKQCRFTPALQNQQPVAVKIDIPITFVLDR